MSFPSVHGLTTQPLSESALRQYIFRTMQTMTLEQKLGQLLLVEYLGNSYQASGLQDMVSHQYVSGFLYNESNHNFDAPYNVAGNVKAFSQQAMHDASIPLLIATDQEEDR